MTNDTKTGFIFKDQDDEIHLGIFENGSVASFERISDWERIYDNLLRTKIAVVEVEYTINAQISIKDLCTLEITRTDDEHDTVEITQLLEELKFPSEAADDMFASFVQSTGRGN